ncbi:unnamed protein product [Orchesella dallaii]|uniref:Odorant receptor n=1 Tax=Orchesella dallaii TaxID=48710 RepID=A0ABP1S748_9HEXA
MEKKKMGFAEAYINVQICFQQIFHTPFYYNVETGRLISNPQLKCRRKMVLWNIMEGITVAILLYSIYHASEIINNYENTGVLDPEEIAVLFLSIAMSSQALVTYLTMERHPDHFVYITTQIFRTGHVEHRGLPTSRRLPDLSELVGYGIAIIFCNFPLIGTIYPLFRNADPVSIILKDVLPEIPRRIIASIFYSFFMLVGAAICALLILLVLSGCQTITKQSERNYKVSVESSWNPTQSWIELRIQALLKSVLLKLEYVRSLRKKTGCSSSCDERNELSLVVIENSNPSLNEKFSRRLRLHYQLDLLMKTSNKNLDPFIPIMAAVGMLICVTFNYALITLHDRKGFEAIVAMIGLLLVAVNFLVDFFCKVACLPLEYSNELIQYWSGQLLGKVEKRQLKSMRPAGLTLGEFFIAKRETALEMNDIILNTTISFLLL